MPIRGRRSIWPKSGRQPTGMFKQPQKQDSVSDMPNQDLMKYAHSSKGRGKVGSEKTKPARVTQHGVIQKGC